ncbi:hypothetical protein ACFVU3_06615 [Streptomyces sp. NPDC058052]|uniref:hypothetical protein n=1 Tax=Streptomyces sp. NPDC058052 TaxID=3346316 RepID=UPI0036EBF862
MSSQKKSAQKPPRKGKTINPVFESGRGYQPGGAARRTTSSHERTPQMPERHEARGGQGQKPREAAGAERDSLVDPRSDPEVMFRLISEKIADKVGQAALKAGTKAANIVSTRLTEELDAAIAGAQSTAGKMGALVQQAVQAAVDDALRTAVLNATRVHEEHLAQLALIDRTAQTTGDLSAVQLRIDAEMGRSGLRRITTPDPETFNVLEAEGDFTSEGFEVLAPAYVDSRSGRIVQRGEMRRRVVPEETADGSAG